jgi:hypothetical protein
VFDAGAKGQNKRAAIAEREADLAKIKKDHDRLWWNNLYAIPGSFLSPVVSAIDYGLSSAVTTLGDGFNGAANVVTDTLTTISNVASTSKLPVPQESKVEPQLVSNSNRKFFFDTESIARPSNWFGPDGMFHFGHYKNADRETAFRNMRTTER